MSLRAMGPCLKTYAIAAAKRLLTLLFSFGFAASFAWAQSEPTQQLPPLECDLGDSQWSCFGSIETVISIDADLPAKPIPMFRHRIVLFTNQELLIEKESFHETPQGESRTATYFLPRPSMVGLSKGWTWETPETGSWRSIEEQRVICETLQAAFPGGAASISEQQQIVVAKIKAFVYPIGEVMENRAVTAWKDDDGTIHFRYKAVGEPIGPYEVFVTWRKTRPEPWPDNHPLPGAASNPERRFQNLGEARAYSPAPRSAGTSAN